MLKLKSLSLESEVLHDKEIEFLFDLWNLRSLNVTNSKVSPAALKELRKPALENVTIVRPK